ncbi:NAC domain-containing protein 67-like protein, partial [Tanacetum coccineum]
MYEIGSPYDGNKFFVTRNFTGYGVMYRDLLGKDNLVEVQIGYNSLFHSANMISTNKGKPRSWKKSIATSAIMYPEALRTVIRSNTVGLDMEVVIRVKVKVETKAGVDMEMAVKVEIRVEVAMCLQVDNTKSMAFLAVPVVVPITDKVVAAVMAWAAVLRLWLVFIHTSVSFDDVWDCSRWRRQEILSRILPHVTNQFETSLTQDMVQTIPCLYNIQ